MEGVRREREEGSPDSFKLKNGSGEFASQEKKKGFLRM
jgi:hypothetical protein